MLQADRVAVSLAESHLKVQLFRRGQDWEYACLCAPKCLSSNYTIPSWGGFSLTFLTWGTGITVCSMTLCGHKALDTVTQMRVWDATVRSVSKWVEEGRCRSKVLLLCKAVCGCRVVGLFTRMASVKRMISSKIVRWQLLLLATLFVCVWDFCLRTVNVTFDLGWCKNVFGFWYGLQACSHWGHISKKSDLNLIWNHMWTWAESELKRSDGNRSRCSCCH